MSGITGLRFFNLRAKRLLLLAAALAISAEGVQAGSATNGPVSVSVTNNTNQALVAYIHWSRYGSTWYQVNLAPRSTGSVKLPGNTSRSVMLVCVVQVPGTNLWANGEKNPKGDSASFTISPGPRKFLIQ